MLYVFDCCSESRDADTGFRAIIMITKAQAHGDLLTSVAGCYNVTGSGQLVLSVLAVLRAASRVRVAEESAFFLEGTNSHVHMSRDSRAGIEMWSGACSVITREDFMHKHYEQKSVFVQFFTRLT